MRCGGIFGVGCGKGFRRQPEVLLLLAVFFVGVFCLIHTASLPFCIKGRPVGYALCTKRRQSHETRKTQRLASLLGGAVRRPAGAAAAGGRHGAAQPRPAAQQSAAGCKKPERGAHPSAQGYRPVYRAAVRGRRDPGFCAGLPERRAELHPSAGSACRAGSALWGQERPPCRLLRRRRACPLPGGAGRGVRPAGGYRLSCHRPGGADKAGGAVRRSAGGLYRGAHPGAAGVVRQRHRGAGHLRRRRPQLFSGAGCRHFSFAPAQRRRPGGGVGCLFPAGAGAAAHHPAAGSAGGEQQPADQPDRRRPCYTGTHAGIFSHQRRAGGYHCRRPARDWAGGHYTVSDASRAAVQSFFNLSPAAEQSASGSEP